MATTLNARYFGKGGDLFRLYLKTSLLTLLTLGIYRFWARTRIRKYIWSATTADQDGFEYTGTGIEKFLGFVVAVVILAIYLGIVQMILFFFGLNLFTDPTTGAQALAQIMAVYITLLAAAPLFFFAQYRARRYKLARTRWRGLRFGMDSAAWGYAFRALGYYLLTLLTLGILIPLTTFRLEKYMADRMWYGDAKFAQGGRWKDLYKGMKHILFGVLILLGSGILAGVSGAPALGVIGVVVGYIWFIVGAIHYRVYSFNYLTRNKTLDGQIAFASKAETGRVVSITIMGGILISIVMALIFGAVGLFVAALMGGLSGASPEMFTSAAGVLMIALLALIYIFALLVAGGLNMVMIVQPILAHIVDNVSLDGAEHLGAIQQRAADPGADAEGFADALDVGGAI